MTKIQIHQFSPAAHYGDGITNGMFYFQKILHQLGFESNIYAENIDAALGESVKKHLTFDTEDKNQLIFIHYSIYYCCEPWIDTIQGHKHIIYHNITPATFFEYGTSLYFTCKRGKWYLPELPIRFEGAIGDSPLNTEELVQANFKNTETIPLLVDASKVLSEPFDKVLYEEKVKEFNIIFVGRIAKNKSQHDLIKIAQAYKKIDTNFKIYIIGSTSDDLYKENLENIIRAQNLEKHVIFTGKISNLELYAYYRAANLFLCMSEHEGFGMPLVESMLLDLPIFAFNSSNIKNTLNGGGVLFDEKSPNEIAATINILKNNPAFKREILNTQRQARKIYKHELIVKQVVEYLQKFHIESQTIDFEETQEILYQFEGPFDSSYSLAMLNRNAALAFEKVHPNRVALYSTEGPGDFEPSLDFLEKHPLVKKLYENATTAQPTKVNFRNLYPPRVTGMKGELNILNLYAWEESGFPLEYVDAFNQNLDGISAVSSYTKKVLQNNGVKTPIKVIPNSVDHILEIDSQSVDLQTNKTFKFLHISSCFPRKGVDILLKAYTDSFTKEDDVTLIIKTFPNPHNTIEEQIANIEKSNPAMPEIELINQDLNDAQIKWLYENADALVAPSRGEGFGLPMAEAMMMHLPVITTAYGGQTDFCKKDNAWLIDFEYAQAQTHLGLFNSYWVEPSLEHLQELLKELFSLSKEALKEKTQKAYALVSTELLWSNYVQKTEAFITELKNEKIFQEQTKEIAWVSSYNTKCGIASYSEFLIEHFDPSLYKVTKLASYAKDVLDQTKEHDVIRCWGNRFDENNDALIENIVEEKYDSLLINFNFGFFSMPNLASIIDAALKAEKKTTIIFHSVTDVELKGQESSLSWILPSLKKASYLLVHTIADMNALKKLGLTNVELLSHGVQNIQNRQIKKQTEEFTIASYGFMLPHKGILELIEAFRLLQEKHPNTKLLLVNAIYPAPVSQEYEKECKSKVTKLGLNAKVTFVTDFLTDAESFKILENADLIVLPYHFTQESSSASVRHALATRKPVLCTSQPIFDDVKDIVHFTKEHSPLSITHSLEKLLSDKTLLLQHNKEQERWIVEHEWKRISSSFTQLL